jgi:hypothetical protein
MRGPQEPRPVEPESCRLVFFALHSLSAWPLASTNRKDHGLAKFDLYEAIRAPNVWAASPLIAVRRLWVSGPISYPLGDDVIKKWSEWQDLNLRPPRPERGVLSRLL